MSISEYKITSYAEGISDLPDSPSEMGYTAEMLKAAFDARSNNEIKDMHNGLIDELENYISESIEAHIADTSNPHSVTKAQVGLSNCDNTADADKPVSDATLSALEAKLDAAEPQGAGESYVYAVNDEGQLLREVKDYLDDSMDPVTAGAVSYALENKQDVLTFDNAPTSGSDNPVKSGGIKTALDGKQDTISDLSTIRSGAALGATALQSVPNTYRTSAAQDVIDAGKIDKLSYSGAGETWLVGFDEFGEFAVATEIDLDPTNRYAVPSSYAVAEYVAENAGSVKIESVTSTSPYFTMEKNTEYRCSNEVFSLTVSGFDFTDASVSSIVFTADESLGVTVAVPNTVTWAVAEPAFEAGKTYWLSFTSYGAGYIGAWSVIA